MSPATRTILINSILSFGAMLGAIATYNGVKQWNASKAPKETK